MSGAPLEIEKKFEVSGQDDLDLLEKTFLALNDKLYRERRYETVIRYVDTKGFDLAAAGVHLRTMDACPPFFPAVITLKTKGAPDENGVLIREEHEFDLPSNDLDLGALASARAQALLAPASGKQLSAKFNTLTRRHDLCVIFNVAGKKAAVELALDRVSYIDAKTGRTLREAFEAEIEFKAKYSAPSLTRDETLLLLKNIADRLGDKVRLSPLTESRADTGFRLLRAA